MADLRFENKNNQKKEQSVFASGVVSTSATMNETLFTLPVAALVTNAYAVITTASGAVTDTVDIKVGATVVANEVIVGVVGTANQVNTTTYTTADASTTVDVVTEGITPAYFATGGSVTVVAGADAPDAAGRIKVIVEYIETELTEGTYTD